MAITGDTTTRTRTTPATQTRREPVTQPAPPPSRSGVPLLRAALRLTLVALLGMAVLHWLGVAVQILGDPNGGFDFISYYAAALALRDNPAANIYTLHTLQVAALAHSAPYPGTRYMYPPLLAVLLLPLTWLRPDTALRLWDIFNLALWLACLALLVRLLRALLGVARPTNEHQPIPTGARLFLVAVVAFLALTYDPVAAGIGLGQINVLICFLALLALDFERRGRPGLAGAALAVASLLKVYPALLLGYYLLRGRWDVLRGAAVTFALLVAGMLPVLGIQGLLESRNFLAAGDSAVVLAHNEALLRAPLWLATLAGGQPGTLASVSGALLVGLVGLAFATGIVRVGRVPSTARTGGWRGWLPRYSRQPTARNEVADITGYLWALCTMVLV
ncbi:MAG: glycosyltransferase 87 family protein, partial [Ktedonobacterales bacterium]